MQIIPSDDPSRLDQPEKYRVTRRIYLVLQQCPTFGISEWLATRPRPENRLSLQFGSIQDSGGRLSRW